MLSLVLGIPWLCQDIRTLRHRAQELESHQRGIPMWCGLWGFQLSRWWSRRKATNELEMETNVSHALQTSSNISKQWRHGHNETTVKIAWLGDVRHGSSLFPIDSEVAPGCGDAWAACRQRELHFGGLHLRNGGKKRRNPLAFFGVFFGGVPGFHLQVFNTSPRHISWVVTLPNFCTRNCRRQWLWDAVGPRLTEFSLVFLSDFHPGTKFLTHADHGDVSFRFQMENLEATCPFPAQPVTENVKQQTDITEILPSLN